MATPFINAPLSTTPAPLLWRPAANNALPLVPNYTPGVLPTAYGPNGASLSTVPVPVGYVPRLRTITPPVSTPPGNPTGSPGGDVLSLSQPASTVPAAEPATPTLPAAESPEALVSASAVPEADPGAAHAAVPAEEPKPPTRGQEIGQKVGQFLDDNPQVLAEVEKLDPDRLMNDPNSLANEIKGQFQRSKVFRLLQRVGLDRRIAGLFPADMEPTVMKVFRWLETPVEPGDFPAEAASEKKKGRSSRKREKSSSIDPGSLAAAAV